MTTEKADEKSLLTFAGMQLLQHLLALDPGRRVSAKLALSYPYFTEEQPFEELGIILLLLIQ